jgi:hypothetical protein
MMIEQKSSKASEKKRLSERKMSAYQSSFTGFTFLDQKAIGRIEMLKIIKRKMPLDVLAKQSLSEFSLDDGGYKVAPDKVREYINEHSLTANIVTVTSRLNKAGLDMTTRLLLAEETVYSALLLNALTNENIKGDNVTGIFDSVLRNMDGKELKFKFPDSTNDIVVDAPKLFFYTHLVKKVLVNNSIKLEDDDPLLNAVIMRAANSGVSLLPGKLEKEVLQILKKVREDDVFPYYVDEFFKRAEVSPPQDGNSIRSAMVSYLRQLNVNITIDDETEFGQGKFDEYFAMAYDHALKVMEGKDDPVTGVYSGAVTDWDYTVDTFETIEEQGISRENIMAAGALYYVYVLGEELAVFKLVDALILLWAGGGLNIPQGSTASMLYRYYQLRDQRATAEERGMVYKRVLDIGNAKLISNAVVNKDFPGLWEKLLEEVVGYIQKSESSSDSQVSKLPIYQATRDLQYNLTSHMTGMAHLQVSETYAHLRESFDILGNAEIVDHFAGGPQKNMWTVIERLWQEEFNAVPNLSSLRTAAVEGNKIFQWIADFEQPSVTEEKFLEFLESAEAYIIANSEIQPGNGKGNGSFDEEEEDFESDDDFDDFDDDWED